MWNNLGSVFIVSCLSPGHEAGTVRRAGGTLQLGGWSRHGEAVCWNQPGGVRRKKAWSSPPGCLHLKADRITTPQRGDQRRVVGQRETCPLGTFCCVLS